MKLSMWITAVVNLLVAPSAFAVMGWADIPEHICAQQLVETNFSVQASGGVFDEYFVQRLNDHLQLRFQSELMQERNYYIYWQQADLREEALEKSREPRLANIKYLGLTLLPSFDSKTNVVSCVADIAGNVLPAGAKTSVPNSLQLDSISVQNPEFVRQRLQMVCDYAMTDALAALPSLGASPCSK